MREALVKFVRYRSKLILDAAAGSLNLAWNLLMASKLPQDGPKIAPRWSKKGQDDQIVAQDKLTCTPTRPKIGPSRAKVVPR